MSQNTFPTNPIFYLPIDLEECSNLQEEQKNNSQESDKFKSINQSEDNNDKNIIIF